MELELEETVDSISSLHSSSTTQSIVDQTAMKTMRKAKSRRRDTNCHLQPSAEHGTQFGFHLQVRILTEQEATLNDDYRGVPQEQM